MVNWLLGHTQRFKALVSHAGRLISHRRRHRGTLVSALGVRRLSVAVRATRSGPRGVADNFKTPTLVITEELDYRVPFGQGLQLFTALQCQEVPSKLLFPDEGHWVLKPGNSWLWHKR